MGGGGGETIFQELRNFVAFVQFETAYIFESNFGHVTHRLGSLFYAENSDANVKSKNVLHFV